MTLVIEDMPALQAAYDLKASSIRNDIQTKIVPRRAA